MGEGLVEEGLARWLREDVIEEGTLFARPPVSSSSQRFRQARGNRWDMHLWPSINDGVMGGVSSGEMVRSSSGFASSSVSRNVTTFSAIGILG